MSGTCVCDDEDKLCTDACRPAPPAEPARAVAVNAPREVAACDHDASEHGGAGCEVFVRNTDPGELGNGRMLRLCPCPANEAQARQGCGPLVLG